MLHQAPPTQSSTKALQCKSNPWNTRGIWRSPHITKFLFPTIKWQVFYTAGFLLRKKNVLGHKIAQWELWDHPVFSYMLFWILLKYSVSKYWTDGYDDCIMGLMDNHVSVFHLCYIAGVLHHTPYLGDRISAFFMHNVYQPIKVFIFI